MFHTLISIDISFPVGGVVVLVQVEINIHAPHTKKEEGKKNKLKVSYLFSFLISCLSF